MIGGEANKAADPQSPAVTGRVVALAAASDFSRFFYPAQVFAVGIRVGAVNAPCVRKDKTGVYIVIPREMPKTL